MIKSYLKPRAVQVNNLFENLILKQKQVKELIHILDSLYPKALRAGDISIAFMSDPSLAQLHDQFLSDPTKTDVITFSGDPDFEFAGEICVSVDRALQVSREFHTTFSEELTLYVVHGFLHLIDYNDIDESDRIKMKQQEKFAMDHLLKLKKIPSFSISHH